MTLLGFLLTGPSATEGPLNGEGGVNRALAAHRTAALTTVSKWLSAVAGTEGVVALTVVSMTALVVLPRTARWPEALFVGGAVVVQSGIFLLITLWVERPRPDVPHLEPSPPTSSFPSGHVGAATALFGALAVLALTRLRGPWRHAPALVLAAVPVAVAASRLYAGMHYPTDVLAGLLNGAGALLVMARTVLPDRPPSRHVDGAVPRGSGALAHRPRTARAMADDGRCEAGGFGGSRAPVGERRADIGKEDDRRTPSGGG
ncbi:phosphatase PAP2 family protein [Streptomyces sp. NPDC016309]|uniref:phosphatase PAP2 family protein n=1 Tax=Streptomyces sp. NPDC016309 TaxID=3364965 RepID=UPI0036F8E1A1